MSIWLAFAFAYALVAAFHFGKLEADDYYRGRNGTAHGVAQNIFWATFWIVFVWF